MDSSHRTLKLLSGAALVLLIGLLVLVVGQIRSLEQRISELSGASQELKRRVEASEATLDATWSDRAECDVSCVWWG